jgi:hypothetical protein
MHGLDRGVVVGPTEVDYMAPNKIFRNTRVEIDAVDAPMTFVQEGHSCRKIQGLGHHLVYDIASALIESTALIEGILRRGQKYGRICKNAKKREFIKVSVCDNPSSMSFAPYRKLQKLYVVKMLQNIYANNYLIFKFFFVEFVVIMLHSVYIFFV